MASAELTGENPSKVFDEPFLWAFCDKATEKYKQYDEEKCGKCMMFFDMSILDAKWKQARRLFFDGQLIGIHGMKVSTSYKNPRASDSKTGVLIFYCGPFDDEMNVMEYGKNLLAVFPYKNSYGYMYYKSDQQTMSGTRATGQKQNSLYKLPVEK